MPQPNDLSRSLVALDQDSTIIAVVEMSQSSWLVAGVLPGAPSTCQVGLAGFRRWQCALGIYDQPMLQISAQTWNVWVLEARSSEAVT